MYLFKKNKDPFLVLAPIPRWPWWRAHLPLLPLSVVCFPPFFFFYLSPVWVAGLYNRFTEMAWLSILHFFWHIYLIYLFLQSRFYSTHPPQVKPLIVKHTKHTPTPQRTTPPTTQPRKHPTKPRKERASRASTKLQGPEQVFYCLTSQHSREEREE